MPGPLNATDALAWIRDAVSNGRYFTHEPHFTKRCSQRRVQIDDWKYAISVASSCVSYSEREPTEGGTNWKVIGPDLDGVSLTVGVEAFQDHLGKRALLITVF